METARPTPFEPPESPAYGRRILLGVALGLGYLAVLLLIDVVLDQESAAVVGTFVVAPFLTALFAGPRETLVVGILATVAAAASPLWNSGTGESDYLVRLGVVLFGTVFASVSAHSHLRARARADRLRLLDAVGEVADGSLPLAETLERVTEAIVPALGDLCMVDAIHEGRATRIATRARGRPDEEEIEQRISEREPSLPPWLVEVERSWRHTPLWREQMSDEDLRRMAHDADDLRFLRSLGCRSYVIVPIVARDRNLGVLTLVSAWSGRHYRADDVQFVRILASRVALALDNAGLFSDLESFERRMDTVMSIIDEAVVMHGPDGELLFANPAAARTLGFDSAEEALEAEVETIGQRFWIRDEHGRELGPGALAGGPALSAGGSDPVTLRVTDREQGVERWLRTRGRPIQGPDGTVIYSVTVIEDVTDVKRAEFAQRLLAKTGELLSHGGDYRRTLDDAAHLLVPEFADWCSISIRRPGAVAEQVAVAHRDRDRERLGAELRKRYPADLDRATGSADVLLTGRPQLLRAIDAEALRARAVDGEHYRILSELGFRSAIAVPITSGGEVAGGITFVNGVESRSFTEADLEVAVEVARRAGVAIENARLAGERARVADLLQRELLPPSLPVIPGWEVETMYQPAGEVNEVGGDFYEVFRIEGGWAIVLGDVSGHGAAAASLTAEARHTIRTAGVLSADPCAGLRLLDRNLRSREDAALCSVVLLVLADPGRAEEAVRVYLAGHPFPLLVRGDSVTEVGSPGPALGVVDDPTWSPASVPMAIGDQLVLYTDGVIEARRPGGERFGVERLRERLAGCRRPDVAVASVRSGLEDFLSQEPEDDAALVVIRWTGGAAGAEDASAERERTLPTPA